MINLQESMLRCWLKPRVESDLPGRMRMVFPRCALLPGAVKPYLHYAEDILGLLPGVQSVRFNARIGSVLVLYDRGLCTPRRILKWVDIAADTGIEIAGGPEAARLKGMDETRVASLVRQRLLQRLPQVQKSE